jgi:hypothetical protein
VNIQNLFVQGSSMAKSFPKKIKKILAETKGQLSSLYAKRLKGKRSQGPVRPRKYFVSDHGGQYDR